MKKLLHSSLLTFALIISGQSFARAGELIFGEGDKWVVFQGPILTEEMDGILSQLDDKKPEQILLNSVGGNLTGAIRFARYVRKEQRTAVRTAHVSNAATRSNGSNARVGACP